MPSNNLYSFPQPLTQVFPPPVLAQRAPLSTDYLYPIGQEWIDESGKNAYFLVNVASNSATWAEAFGVAAMDSLTGDSGVATAASGTVTVTGGTTGLTTSGSGATLTLTGTLVVANGGTGAATLTAHGVVLGEGTSAVNITAAGAVGTVLAGAGASTDPSFVALSELNIVNNTTGTVASPTSIVVETTYIANEASVTTGFLLPATAVQGQRFTIIGNGPGGWQIQQNASQGIKVANIATTVGTAGSLSSTSAYGSITLVATVGGASTIWVAANSTGTFTAV